MSFHRIKLDSVLPSKFPNNSKRLVNLHKINDLRGKRPKKNSNKVEEYLLAKGRLILGGGKDVEVGGDLPSECYECIIKF